MNKKSISITVLIIITLGFVFYWFQLRPIEIKRKCVDIATETINVNNSGRGYVPIAEREYNNKDFKNYYEICLLKKGLNN